MLPPLMHLLYPILETRFENIIFQVLTLLALNIPQRKWQEKSIILWLFMVLTTSANPFDRTERFVKHFMPFLHRC